MRMSPYISLRRENVLSWKECRHKWFGGVGDQQQYESDPENDIEVEQRKCSTSGHPNMYKLLWLYL
jgi:hypothetical protein